MFVSPVEPIVKAAVPVTDAIVKALTFVINPLTDVCDVKPPTEVLVVPEREADMPFAENESLAFKLIVLALTLKAPSAENDIFFLDLKLILPSTSTVILPCT